MPKGKRKQPETMYPVEAILKASRTETGPGKSVEVGAGWSYLVKWKGFPESESTWEPFEHVQSCSLLLGAFWRHALPPGCTSANITTVAGFEVEGDPEWIREQRHGSPTSDSHSTDEGKTSIASESSSRTTTRIPEASHSPSTSPRLMIRLPSLSPQKNPERPRKKRKLDPECLPRSSTQSLSPRAAARLSPPPSPESSMNQDASPGCEWDGDNSSTLLNSPQETEFAPIGALGSADDATHSELESPSSSPSSFISPDEAYHSLRDGATGGNSLEPEDFADAMGDAEAWLDYIAL
ncbi:hypothetical protein C8J57DRAFT_1495663 [Mycena rebaudengoi]|nr:hypothetical protein C8J57DRAFT_1495663 [Mycena rebaudengoi]